MFKLAAVFITTALETLKIRAGYQKDILLYLAGVVLVIFFVFVIVKII